MRSTVALRSTSARTTAVRPAVASRRVVVAKAVNIQELTNMVGNAFVRIFSKPQSNVEKFAENNFTGKIQHHGTRKPFADGWKAPVNISEVDVKNSDDESMEYLGGAVKRVMGNNFSGDKATEPEKYPATDFKGKIHTGRGAERDGFHTKKY